MSAVSERETRPIFRRPSIPRLRNQLLLLRNSSEWTRHSLFTTDCCWNQKSPGTWLTDWVELDNFLLPLIPREKLRSPSPLEKISRWLPNWRWKSSAFGFSNIGGNKNRLPLFSSKRLRYSFIVAQCVRKCGQTYVVLSLWRNRTEFSGWQLRATWILKMWLK